MNGLRWNTLAIVVASISISLAGFPRAPLLAAEPPAAESEFSPESLEFFEKEVRPLLVVRCGDCHSASSKEIKAGLRLDSRAAVVKGGESGPAAVPGNPAKSLLVDAINYGEQVQMPPKTKLPANEIAILTKWVEMGLPWPKEKVANVSTPDPKKPVFDISARKSAHWAWKPVQRRAPPEVKNSAWPATDIDRFILAGIEKQGLEPAAPAEKTTLLRRIYFDLVGLPPSPANVDAFLADESPQAVAHVVDKLLDSPQFGERWARHWLDLVRYADSRGHEFDNTLPNAWQYRDYVIRALNADVPYDQFLTEHLAGDLLETPRLNPKTGGNESILGTGFWFLGEWVHSPVDIRKDETDRHDNMLDVMSKTFLGLTVACARCHDHKFDPISQADYYALSGYLHSTGYRQVAFQTLPHNMGIAKKLGEIRTQIRALAGKTEALRNATVVAELGRYLTAAHQACARDPKTPPTKEVVAEIAAAQKLSEPLLTRWCQRLFEAKGDPKDVLHLLAIAPADPKFVDFLKDQRQEQTKQLEQKQEQLKAIDVLVDFSRPGPDDFFADGPLFTNGLVRQGQLELGDSAQNPLRGAATYATVRGDMVFAGLKNAPGTENGAGAADSLPRTGRTFRTRTFENAKGQLHYLVRGSGWAFAVVDSHWMVAGPLHGQVLKGFDGRGEWMWVTHDLQPYRDHRMHIEFTPKGNAPFEVLAVVQGNRGSLPPLPLAQATPASPLASAARSNKMPATLADFADIYQHAFQEANTQLQAGGAPLVSSPAAPSAPAKNNPSLDDSFSAELLKMLVVRRDLFRVEENPTPGEPSPELSKLFADMQAAIAGIKLESPTSQAMWEGSRADDRLLLRGVSNRPGEIVPRRMLTALGGDQQSDVPTGSGRMELVRQFLDPRNPFPARVMANRVWHHLFGRGIVPTVDNFGVLGEPPSHEELLDFLATQLVQEGWSVKKLIRTIMLSRVYQLDSLESPAARQSDPANRWLSHAPLRRLEAEALRDSILAVSGRLELKTEGPSVPIFLTAFLEGRGRPASGPVDGNGRRSIYLAVRRNFLSPMMLAFDMPQPIGSIGRRNLSNVPAQALTLMNDPFVVGEARRWAARVLKEPMPSANDRIRAMYKNALARDPSAEELADLSKFLAEQGKQYQLAGDAWEKDERVWADLAHVIINTKEFLYLR